MAVVFASFKLANVFVAVAEEPFTKGLKVGVAIVSPLNRLYVQTLHAWYFRIFCMWLEPQAMQLSIGIIVPNSQLIMIILDMHIFRFLKGKFKGLFVFHPHNLSNRIPLEHILIILPIQMQDLLHHHSILKVQLM